MQEGTTSRVTAANRPYGEFYDLYSVSPENFGYHLVAILKMCVYYFNTNLTPIFTLKILE